MEQKQRRDNDKDKGPREKKKGDKLEFAAGNLIIVIIIFIIIVHLPFLRKALKRSPNLCLALKLSLLLERVEEEADPSSVVAVIVVVGPWTPLTVRPLLLLLTRCWRRGLRGDDDEEGDVGGSTVALPTPTGFLLDAEKDPLSSRKVVGLSTCVDVGVDGGWWSLMVLLVRLLVTRLSCCCASCWFWALATHASVRRRKWTQTSWNLDRSPFVPWILLKPTSESSQRFTRLA